METRELHESELDELLTLYSHMHVADDPLPERSIIEYIWHEIHDNPYFRYFGTFVDRKLVSSCTLSVIPNLTRGCRPYGVIENVVTHAVYRRRGYASGILRHALNYAWSKGCVVVAAAGNRGTSSPF